MVKDGSGLTTLFEVSMAVSSKPTSFQN